ncbi:thiamine phosphate synthase [Desulfothermobacter acidiphilus]|uniref:thiamine phosphate synthase n=1 Tax=Desulfothermobacter acidiphilus TaxID=1938353 RepID=UPI003F8AB4BC
MWRIVDANRNRLREGLRVLEDLARFVLQERRWAEEARSFRHVLAEADQTTQNCCLASRDVDSDWGKEYRPSPYSSLEALVRANCRRVQEAARVLEECSRLCCPEQEEGFRRVRFWAYAAEKYLVPSAARSDRRRRCQVWRLYVIVGSEYTGGRAVEEVVRAAIAGGAEAIQLREKQLPTRDAYHLACRLRHLTREAGVDLIINDRVDLALAVEADGVHLGAEDLPLDAARRLLGHRYLLGATAHTLAEARAAQAAGADYLGVGPVFFSPTKPELIPGGLELLREVAAQVEVPVVAIGGITVDNVGQVLAVPGVRCVAVVRSVLGALDVAKAAAELKRVMEGIADDATRSGS